jgi:aryl-alcohol dehydrogenase-like predicted oxidoreductase
MELSANIVSRLIILDAECRSKVKKITDEQLEQEIEDQLRTTETKYQDLLTIHQTQCPICY